MKKPYILISLAIVFPLIVVWFLFSRVPVQVTTTPTKIGTIPVQVATMSEAASPPQYGLKVGPSVLGWSSHENGSRERNGYIYMRDERPEGGNKPLWEFALTTKRQLSDVTAQDLRCPFYGMDDQRGPGVFGDAWAADGSAIQVPEGQVFFARLVSDRSVIYAIRLANQRGPQSGEATMKIEYIEFSTQPPIIPPELVGVWAPASSKLRYGLVNDGYSIDINTNGDAALVGAPPPIGVPCQACYNSTNHVLTLKVNEKPKARTIFFSYDPKTQKLSLTNGTAEEVLIRKWERPAELDLEQWKMLRGGKPPVQ